MCYIIQYFFDTMDGNFARKYNQTSDFGDKLDHISMYVSSKVNPDLSPMLDFYITKELGIKSDKQIMEEYECFFNSESLQNCN